MRVDSHQISILSEGQQLKFYPAKYYVDIVGGLDIALNDFSIALMDEEGSAIRLSTFTFPVQSMYGWTRAKRTFEVNIPKAGVYTIQFHNPSSLVVKRSNIAVFPLSLFNKPIPSEEISVVFYRKK